MGDLELENEYGKLEITITDIDLPRHGTIGIVTVSKNNKVSSYYFNVSDAEKIFEFFRRLLIEARRKEIKLLEKLGWYSKFWKK